jgi:hypothetical protein
MRMSPMGCWVNIKDQVVISSPESPGPSATDLLNLHLRFGGALTLKQLFLAVSKLAQLRSRLFLRLLLSRMLLRHPCALLSKDRRSEDLSPGL